MGSFAQGIFAGFGERAREKSMLDLELEMARRQKIVDFWAKQAADPANRPQAQQVAARKWQVGAMASANKPFPKDPETLEDFLNVPVEEQPPAKQMPPTQLQMGGRTVTAGPQAWKPQPIPVPGGEIQAEAAVPPGVLPGTPIQEPARPIPIPPVPQMVLPPPQTVTRPPRFSREELAGMEERELRARYRAQYQAQREAAEEKERAGEAKERRDIETLVNAGTPRGLATRIILAHRVRGGITPPAPKSVNVVLDDKTEVAAQEVVDPLTDVLHYQTMNGTDITSRVRRVIGKTEDRHESLDQQALNDYLKKNPGKTALDFTEHMRTLRTSFSFNLSNPQQEPATVDYVVENLLQPGGERFWNELTGGNKALQNQVRQALARKGMTLETLTTSSRQLGETAKVLVPAIQETIKKLDTPEFQKMLGPIMSRWNNFLTGTVGKGPEYAFLRSTMGMIVTGTMRAHVGARGGQQLMEHFKSLADSRIMDAETLKASLTAMSGFLEKYAKALTRDTGGASSTGVPTVGAQFQGERVVKVEKIK